MNIYEMAEQASRCNNYWLEHFAALVAAAARADEREECAKVCDEARAARLAEQIRARGNT
jgi:hypothetical protein